MADNKRPESRQANQTGQSGNPQDQQLHRKQGGIGNPLSRNKNTSNRNNIDETGESRRFKGKMQQKDR
jgi:hypothetical protein